MIKNDNITNFTNVDNNNVRLVMFIKECFVTILESLANKTTKTLSMSLTYSSGDNYS